MRFYIILAWVGGGLSMALAAAAVAQRRPSLVRWLFGAGMVLLALEAFFVGQSFATIMPERILFWQNLRVATFMLLPGIWLLFSLAYSRGNFREFLRHWRGTWITCLLLPLLLGLWARGQFIVGAEEGSEPYQWYLDLSPPGRLLMLVLLGASILTLMNLERTFRASVGTMRWRIKYMIIGLAVLLGVLIYTSSQNLLYGQINLLLSGLNLIALVMSILLMGVSVWRVGLQSQDVYPSQSFVHYSITGLLVGIYLLLVGVLAKVVTVWGGDAAFPVKASFVLLSLVALAILLLSERARRRARRFISRHLRRPHYDYRQAWTKFTEQTSSLTDRQQFGRVVVRWISDTLALLSINLWMLDESRGRFVLLASSSQQERNHDAGMPVDEEADHFIQNVLQKPQPVRLGDTSDPWLKNLEQLNPQFFPVGQQQVCVPLVAGGRFLGLMTLADRVDSQPFSEEEMDLLKTVADPIAANLLNHELGDRLLQVREMEAFQVMSAFFVHDLKNTASTLNLMLKNLPLHFDDPDFRADALRGLGKSVNHINELIGRLGMIREALELHRLPADLNQVVRDAVQPLNPPDTVTIQLDLAEVPQIAIDADQIRKVVSNLLHNAVDAMKSPGSIQIQTLRRRQWLVVSVRDTGCGMTPEFLNQSLFRPFQTTKNKGIGIGLFLSRRVIEAHGGKIEVQSTLGKGTTFQLFLPTEST